MSRARARSTDPATSHAAAASVDNLRASQWAVLRVLRTNGPSTDGELAHRYAFGVASGTLPRQSESGIRTRRSELVAGGHVVDTGERRLLPTGRYATVWAARRLTLF